LIRSEGIGEQEDTSRKDEDVGEEVGEKSSGKRLIVRNVWKRRISDFKFRGE